MQLDHQTRSRRRRNHDSYANELIKLWTVNNSLYLQDESCHCRGGLAGTPRNSTETLNRKPTLSWFAHTVNI
jgi:hypothetical protein